LELVRIYINTYYELKSGIEYINLLKFFINSISKPFLKGLEQNSLMLNLFESTDSICKIRDSMQSLIQNLIKILNQKNYNNHQFEYINDLIEKCVFIDEKQMIN
jgi:hypothetical protein